MNESRSEPTRMFSQPSFEPPDPLRPRKQNLESWWWLKFWAGMNFGAWARLVWRHAFSIRCKSVPDFLFFCLVSSMNSGLRIVKTIFWNSRVRRTVITEHPIFIVGHWRSGTTFLHELLSLDDRHTYPTTYECFSPNHFLLTEKWFTRWFAIFLPSHRPMDDVSIGWSRPQEDEFAMCNLGELSPYLSIAFPNDPKIYDLYTKYLNLEGLPPQNVQRWKNALMCFLKEITCLRPKRIVLKSPTHTGRIKVLLQMFPDARFVHIVRDPMVLYPSTLHTWTWFYRLYALQTPRYELLNERVFDNLTRMYRVFERDRHLIKPGRLVELHYEDLVQDPMGTLRSVYRELELGDFDRLVPSIERYLAGTREYRTNQYQLAPELAPEIGERWKPYLDKYGYLATDPNSAHIASGTPADDRAV